MIDYETLKAHIGHDVGLAWYGGQSDPVNVTIECETCSVVLVDFDRPDLAHEDDDDLEGAPGQVIAARTADLRCMLDSGDDHFEGIDKDDALRELLDALDAQRSA